VAAWCGAGDRVPLEKIVRDRGWAEVRAVREGRVYCIRDEFLNTPAPTLTFGLQALAAAITPNAFPGLADSDVCLTYPVSHALGKRLWFKIEVMNASSTIEKIEAKNLESVEDCSPLVGENSESSPS